MKFIFVIIFSVLSFWAQAQNAYYVVKVKGDIHNLSDSTALKSGSVIHEADQLKFSGLYDYAMIISSSKERMTLRFETSFSEIEKPFIIEAQNALFLVESKSELTRGIQKVRNIDDLEQYFGEESFCIIGDSLVINLDKRSYPLTDASIIQAGFEYEAIAHEEPLNFTGQDLLIVRSDFDTESGTAIVDEVINSVELSTVDKTTNHKETIANFELSFIQEEEVYEELSTVYQIIKNHEMEIYEMRNYMYDYFYDFYGRTSRLHLSTVINEVVQ